MTFLSRGILILFSLLIFLTGCEKIYYEPKEIEVSVVEKKKEIETVEGDCSLISDGNSVFLTTCEDDTKKTHYYVTLLYNGKKYKVDNKKMFESKITEVKATLMQRIGEDSGKVYKEYIDRVFP